jgi:hypothetical protein
MTPDNLSSTWVHFEAGALAKVVDTSRVAPVLFRLKPSDISGPLSQFQLTTNLEHDEVKKLVQSINSCAGNTSLDVGRLDRAFDAVWFKLKENIAAIEMQSELPLPRRRDLDHVANTLEEVLALARQQAQIFASGDTVDGLLRGIEHRIDRVFERKGYVRDEEAVWRKLILSHVRNRAPLPEIIGRYIRLTKAGKEYRGLCPFHKERSSSFHVVEDKKFYHCFGCGAHGSAVDFVMAVEGLDFSEAVKRYLRNTCDPYPW